MGGATRAIADVLLETSQTDTVYTGPTTISTAAAANPALKGYGNLIDLRIQQTIDAAGTGNLLSLVNTFKGLAAATNWAALKTSAEGILYRWAGVEGVAATSLGQGMDLRKLAFIEKQTGYLLAPRDGNGVVVANNVAELKALWDQALDMATIRLAVQGPWKTANDNPPSVRQRAA